MTTVEVADMRHKYEETVKKMFIVAKRPDFVILSTSDSGKLERGLVRKVLGSGDADLAEAMRSRYLANLKTRRASTSATSKGKQVEGYTLRALFSKTRTNLLTRFGRVATDGWYDEAIDQVPGSERTGVAEWTRKDSALWWLRGRRWNKTAAGRVGMLRALRCLRCKLGLPIRQSKEVFSGVQREPAARAHLAFIATKVSGRVACVRGG